MSEQQQQSPLTYEMVLEMFRETREQMKETDRLFRETREQFREMSAETDRQFREAREEMKKTDRQMKETDRKISALGSRIGEIIENMVGGNIVEQFQALDIAIKSHSRYKTFGTGGISESGEIDVFLENGDLVILIEVKTKLTDNDVREHIERIQKYRRYGGEKRRILGAVAGAVASKEVIHFAYKQGLYVIIQSGDAVEIVPPPEGFTAKEW